MRADPGTEPQIAYNGLMLDRGAGRRDDPGWVQAVLHRPMSLVIPFWMDKCFIRDDPAAGGPQPVTVPAARAADLLAAATTTVLLGLDGEAGVFAADLSALPEAAAAALAGATGTADVRALFPALGSRQAAMLGYARGILRWHCDQRCCGVCGQPTAARAGGAHRQCGGAGCGRLLFPRLEPAVIALVEAPEPPDRCLLARRRGAAADAWAAPAGFVEIGESLEDAVRREIAEETGVQIGPVWYQASQAWPFPSGLMIGFRARAASLDIEVDHTELDEARWFTRAGVTEVVGKRPLDTGDSIESYLVGAWLRETG